MKRATRPVQPRKLTGTVDCGVPASVWLPKQCATV